MSDLIDATKTLDERKSAIFGGAESATLEESDARLFTSGFDLDFDEVVVLGTRVAEIGIVGAMTGDCDLVASLRGAWVDGLLTGLILAEQRAKRREATS